MADVYSVTTTVMQSRQPYKIQRTWITLDNPFCVVGHYTMSQDILFHNITLCQGIQVDGLGIWSAVRCLQNVLIQSDSVTPSAREPMDNSYLYLSRTLLAMMFLSRCAIIRVWLSFTSVCSVLTRYKRDNNRFRNRLAESTSNSAR